MLGLTLEGGGARGAFEIGAIKAFLENGYKFDGVTGTSIGSINAAFLAQGEFEKAYSLWEEMELENLFPEQSDLLRTFVTGDFELASAPALVKKGHELLKSGGLDIGRIRELLEKYVDEEKIRLSDMEFGLVTVSLTDKKAQELFTGDIPDGELVNYLLASSMLPVFKNEKLNDKLFADGGYSDCCPYNMLIERGYDELVIIRVFGTGLTRKMKGKNTKIQMVIPSDKLGNILDFSNATVKYEMKMGYFDANRVIKGYKGRKYYILHENDDRYFERLLSIPQPYIKAAAKIFELPNLPGKRMLFDGIIPLLASALKLNEDFTYEELVIAMVESVALAKNIDRFRVMSFTDLLAETVNTSYPDADKKFEEIVFPYRAAGETAKTFRLPIAPLSCSYSYKMPNGQKLGSALELLLKAMHLCEKRSAKEAEE